MQGTSRAPALHTLPYCRPSPKRQAVKPVVPFAHIFPSGYCRLAYGETYPSLLRMASWLIAALLWRPIVKPLNPSTAIVVPFLGVLFVFYNTFNFFSPFLFLTLLNKAM
ncbi:hypothetical protein V8C37DRAFT_363778 [Trichoderma ceciliae]